MDRPLPKRDFDLLHWAAAFEGSFGQKPTVDDLLPKQKEALGKVVYEYLDWRDVHKYEATDSMCYIVALIDHGIERSPNLDGVDVDLHRQSRIPGEGIAKEDMQFYRSDLVKADIARRCSEKYGVL